MKPFWLGPYPGCFPGSSNVAPLRAEAWPGQVGWPAALVSVEVFADHESAMKKAQGWPLLGFLDHCWLKADCFHPQIFSGIRMA